MKLTDEQALRVRLREEFGALEISPAPVLRVTGRGQGIRTRRRALTAAAVIAALVVAAAAQLNRPVTGPTVTLKAPDPAAPGGVFASGTADGKPWTLAVRNIVAAPGTGRCLPAVMFSGRDGDVLFKVAPGAPSFGNPALLASPPGFPGITVAFTQVAPDVTRLVAIFSGGRRLSVRPVWVPACAQRFHLAGFAYARAPHGISELATNSGAGPGDGLAVTPADLNPLTPANLYTTGPTSPGIWSNLDDTRADVAASEAQHRIGAGTIGGQVWHIRTSLGLFGQCYTATLRGPGSDRGQGSECVPVAAPTRTITLAWVPVPGATTELSGYAGLVSSRTARVGITLSDGTIPPARPVTVAGRPYIAFVIPPGCQVLRLKLFDSAGHMFASTSTVPPAK